MREGKPDRPTRPYPHVRSLAGHSVSRLTSVACRAEGEGPGLVKARAISLADCCFYLKNEILRTLSLRETKLYSAGGLKHRFDRGIPRPVRVRLVHE